MENLIESYEEKKIEIKSRLQDFRKVWKSNDNLFEELAFCLFTPQSKAEACWKAVCDLKENGLLYDGSSSQLAKYMQSVRFYNNKINHLIGARKFANGELRRELENLNQEEAREWLVENVKGFGYKEASHFLRNVGFAEDLMILDRHILKNLVKHRAIREIPKSMTPSKYFEIEDKMKRFASKVGIPPAELDILLWSQETGKVFK
ncbi:MAG: N-glycosylase/DNA lyase [Candidatus Aenigmatarchaeota archaeon]